MAIGRKEVLMGAGVLGLVGLGAAGSWFGRDVFGGGTVASEFAKTQTPVATPEKPDLTRPVLVVTATPEATRLALVAAAAPLTEGDIRRIVLTSVAEGRQSAPSATVKPESKPSATAASAPKENEVEHVTDHSMGKGERYILAQDGIVVGDVFADGTRLFDNRSETGLMVQAKKGTEILAPHGADVTFLGDNPNPTTVSRLVGSLLEQTKQAGCGRPTGCDVVEVVKWPGGKPQGKK